VVPRLERADIPIVFVDAHENTSGLPRVFGDDENGGRLATEHLLGLGHRRIGFIGDEFANPFGFTSSRDRFAGYTRALTDAGLVPAAEEVALGAHGRYEARDLAATMLSQAHRPTAIFAASDTQALGVLAAAQDLGLHVPDDLSVIGYDDIEACDFVGLTTVRQHLFESGRQGAQLLMAEIVERVAPPPVVVIPPEIVRRRTTGPRKEGRRQD
jgi:LacI family transcriptional regulator